MTSVAERIAERIHREGAIPFDAFMEEALYGNGGFFARGRGSGRAGADFLTSPEVGPLFGALVARALDAYWDDLGAPDPFFVVEAGAGRGRLAADVLHASPRCGPALRYVLVERSDVRRAEQRDLVLLEPVEDAVGPVLPGDDDTGSLAVTRLGPIATSLADLPAISVVGVVVGNELVDNLPFRIVERTDDGWDEVRVGATAAGFVETLVPAAPDLAAEADVIAVGEAPTGARLPVPTGVHDWLQACTSLLERGVLILIDYLEPARELIARGEQHWLRTYRAHERAGSPLVAPGNQDITADVPLEYVVHVATAGGFVLDRNMSQSEWLDELGIDDLVASARAAWDARAHVGDLEAVRQRSRVSEAAALVERSGLGSHRVLVFRTG